MMRVLHIVSEGIATGTAMQLRLLSQGLRCRGIETSICSLERFPEDQRRLRDLLGPCVFSARNWHFDPTLVSRLASRIRNCRPHVLHTWNSSANHYGRLAASWSPTAIIGGFRDQAAVLDAVHSPLGRLLNRRSQALVTNGRHLQHALQTSSANTSVRLIANASVPGSMPPKVAERDSRTSQTLARSLGFPTADLVGVIGDLRREKNIKDAIWAIDLLRVIRPGCRLVIAGHGSDETRLREFANLVQSRDAIDFLGFRCDVNEWLPQLKCVWIPGQGEGTSNTLLQAFAAGVPVIAADVPDKRALIGNLPLARFVPLGDRAEYARGLNVLLDQPDAQKRMTSEARKWVSERFSLDAMVDQYIQLYRESIHAKQASGRSNPRRAA